MEFLIVLGSGVFLMGLAYAVWIGVIKRRAQGTGNWPRTQGQVEASFLYEHQRQTAAGVIRSYTPVVRYTYRVNGQDYESDRRNFLPHDTKTFDNRLDAESVVVTYAEESPVPVYYNPHNPKQAVLEIPKPQAHRAELWYGVTNVICGIGVLVLGIVLSR
jgi:hypothetical protein